MFTCIYPKCDELATKDSWCRQHWGYFPHKCDERGCDARVLYNDEPYCFTHSPDSGSSVRGYSAYKNSLAVNRGND